MCISTTYIYLSTRYSRCLLCPHILFICIAILYSCKSRQTDKQINLFLFGKNREIIYLILALFGVTEKFFGFLPVFKNRIETYVDTARSF